MQVLGMKLGCLIFTAILEDCQISGIMMREILGNLAARGEKEKEEAREKDKEGEGIQFFLDIACDRIKRNEMCL